MHTQSEFGFRQDLPLGARPHARRSGSNLFIALRPDAAAAVQARAIAHDIRAAYRVERQPQTLERLHVSMIGLGLGEALDESTVFQARAAIDSVRFEPFEIAFDSIMSFRSGPAFPVVLTLGYRSLPLIRLRDRLADALDGQGVDHSGRTGFEPHMTLLYHHAAIQPERLASPIVLTVDQAWLIHSLVGQTKYEFLWPLRQ